MFTGIIQSVAPILSVASRGECLHVRIKRPSGWKLAQGQSVAVDGVCSTVMAIKPSFFEVEYMPETFAKTTVGSFQKNTLVNLERPLALRDLVDGGLVQGHVDARGTIRSIEKDGKTQTLAVAVPKALEKYIASKGSVTINGVNLTVAWVKKGTFGVALIPYTLTHTNLGSLQKGNAVNIEIDVIARYVAHILKADN